MCYLFHEKSKAEENGDSSSSNGQHALLVNGNTATEFNLVTELSCSNIVVSYPNISTSHYTA